MQFPQLESKIAGNILRSAIEQTTSPVVVCDADPALDNPIIFANLAYSKLSGFSSKDVLGRNPRFMHGKAREQPELDIVRKAIRQGNSCDVAVKNYKKNGSPYWCQLSLSPVFNSQNILTHWISIQKDITDSVLLEQHREEFIALFAHDVKNPILGSNLVLDYLSSENPNLSKELETLKSSNDEILRLLWNIMDLYRLEKGDLVNHLDSDVKRILADCVHQLNYFASTKNITVQLDGNSALIQCNEQLIYRLFLNLIHNAISYTPNGGKVQVSVSRNDRVIEIEVSDTGKGISESDMPKLFLKFPKIANHTKQSTGLGLYLSKQIIEQHNGTINCQSIINKGTTFTVTLPTLK